MFDLDVPDTVPSRPWATSFEERRRQLTGRQYRIAFYYGLAPDNGTFRYRISNMVNALNRTGGTMTAACFYYSDLDRLAELVDVIDTLVICRGKYSPQLGHVITVARNKGKNIIFDIDDLMFDPRYMHLVLRTADADYSRFTQEEVWQYWYGDCARYAATMFLCDRVVTTNSYLAQKIRDFSGKEVFVVPNYLNDEQLKFSAKIFRQKNDHDFTRHGPVYLGYFSGSHTHNHDFRILTDPLTILFEKYPNLKLRVVGMLDLDARLGPWTDRIERLRVQNYLNLQKYIGEVEINLVPLQVNTFTNCKSELKYFEAAIVGTPSIASPTHVYTHAIQDGHNGYLSNSYEWFDKIDAVLSNTDHYKELSRNACSHAIQQYAWHNLTSVIEKAYLF